MQLYSNYTRGVKARIEARVSTRAHPLPAGSYLPLHLWLSLHGARCGYFQQPGSPWWPQHACRFASRVHMFRAISLSFLSAGIGL